MGFINKGSVRKILHAAKLLSDFGADRGLVHSAWGFNEKPLDPDKGKTSVLAIDALYGLSKIAVTDVINNPPSGLLGGFHEINSEKPWFVGDIIAALEGVYQIEHVRGVVGSRASDCLVVGADDILVEDRLVVCVDGSLIKKRLVGCIFVMCFFLMNGLESLSGDDNLSIHHLLESNIDRLKFFMVCMHGGK